MMKKQNNPSLVKWILKIPSNKGNLIIKFLQESNKINAMYKIFSEGEFIFIPLNQKIDDLSGKLKNINFEIIPAKNKQDFLKIRNSCFKRNLKEALCDIIPINLHDIIPRAFDIIGNIAIIELNRTDQQPLRPFIKEIGRILLNTHPNIESVYEKASSIEGVYRTRKLNFIAGKHNTTTIYKENQCRYYIDVEKTFFSPRLAFERQRVATLNTEFNTNGIVWDVFCGVGSFILQISKHYPNGKYFGTDINNRAIELAEKNVDLNKINAQILFNCQDISKIANYSGVNRLYHNVSRFIMNLPEKSILFLKFLHPFIHEKGSLLHIYQFNKKEQALQEAKEKLEKELIKSNIKLKKIQFSRIVKSFSPALEMTVLDIIVSAKKMK